jgi:hypothetical protein
MFNWLKRLTSPSRAVPPCARRPALEALEPRLVPAKTKAAPPPPAPHFSVGVDAAGNQHLFVLGLDNQIYEANTNSSGTPTSPYFLVTPSQVKAFSVTTDSANKLHLFAIGLDDQVWQLLFNNSGMATGGWTLTRPGVVKTLTAGRDSANDPEIFVTGLDSQIYTLAFNADGSIFANTPSYVLTAPGVVKSFVVAPPNVNKNPELFAMLTDNQVWEATAPTAVASYNPFKVQVPGQIKALSVGADSANNLHLFAIGLDDQVYQALFDSNGNATSSYQLTFPGRVKAVSAGETGLSHPLIFAIGLDSQVYTLGFNDNGTLLSQTPRYFLTAAGPVNAITVGTANSRSSLFAFRLDAQVYESVSLSFPTFQPYVLVAPGQIK